MTSAFLVHSFRMEEVGPEMLDSTTSIRGVAPSPATLPVGTGWQPCLPTAFADVTDSERNNWSRSLPSSRFGSFFPPPREGVIWGEGSCPV